MINPKIYFLPEEEKQLISHVADFCVFLDRILININKDNPIEAGHIGLLLIKLQDTLNEDILNELTTSEKSSVKPKQYTANALSEKSTNITFQTFYTFIKNKSEQCKALSNNNKSTMNDFAIKIIDPLGDILYKKYNNPEEKDIFLWNSIFKEDFKERLNLKSHATEFNIPKAKSTDKTNNNNYNSFTFASIGIILFFIYVLGNEYF